MNFQVFLESVNDCNYYELVSSKIEGVLVR
jgi:hypothetical protein